MGEEFTPLHLLTPEQIARQNEDAKRNQDWALARIKALLQQRATKPAPTSNMGASVITRAMIIGARGRDLRDRNALPDY